MSAPAIVRPGISEIDLITAERLVDGAEYLIEACDRFAAAKPNTQLDAAARRERKLARAEIVRRRDGIAALRRLIDLARRQSR